MSRSGLEVLRHILDESDYLLASSSGLRREEILEILRAEKDREERS
jgi:hypothetical protein